MSVALLAPLMAVCAAAERQIWTTHRYNEPLFSPNGESLLVQAFVPPRNEEIFLLSADGTQVRNLTQHPAADSSPRWSPDGRSILFFSDRDGDGREAMYTMSPDGSGVARVPGQASGLGNLSWSPDGASILYEGKEGVTVAAPDGSRSRVIAPRGKDPIWSPDGKSILYWLFPQWEMRIVSLDGNEDRKIANGNPITWTPDGKSVFYVSPWAGQGKPRHVYRVNANGSDPRMVLKNVQLSVNIADAHRLWSPDGAHLALAVESSTGWRRTTGIVILDRDGRTVRDFRKSERFLYDSTLSWRDARTLAFSRFYLLADREWMLPEDDGGVYLLNTDTGETRHLIRNEAAWIDPHNPPW